MECARTCDSGAVDEKNLNCSEEKSKQLFKKKITNDIKINTVKTIVSIRNLWSTVEANHEVLCFFSPSSTQIIRSILYVNFFQQQFDAQAKWTQTILLIIFYVQLTYYL